MGLPLLTHGLRRNPFALVPGTVVAMAPEFCLCVQGVHRIRAFPWPGLLRECLGAVEQRAVSDGRSEMSAACRDSQSQLASWLLATRVRALRAGVRTEASLARQQSRMPMRDAMHWSKDIDKTPAAVFRSSAEAFPRRS
jgi:hypothetical protein